MKFKSKKLANKYRLSLEGECLFGSAAALKSKLLNAINKNTPIELDLSQVSEIDTSCYQLIVQFTQECTTDGVELSIGKMSKAFTDVVNIYGMDNYFNC